ncbi:MAG: Na+/H+ antiporter NhaA [Gammaproteobacteria bacterium]|nr:Na+/H+ antiporter NhaA [Gammaproteobacteria bacterium]MDH3362778.1 Na+/H+ antiporter NhaA [Gammaproteobacteria bacterium]MDH3480198.1 Na+/H+ antiporter NhaA [Gammaproteobacteria bacterium]
MLKPLVPKVIVDSLTDFLDLESSSGILLVIAAVLAMVVANSPLAPIYDSLIDLPVGLRVGALEIEKPLLLWINDGLMAIFFFLVGLELKREVLEGQLSDAREIVLPALGAFGGMALPAAIYVWVNQGNDIALQGWAIPAATDIAFALAILALLGSRVPLSLKIFLVSVAIFDDVGAIVIIALFYTSDLSVAALVTAACCLPVLYALNRRGVSEITPYFFVGLIMWVAVLKSGVHATLAGVVLAVFIPLRDPDKESSPLHEIEHDLHTAVAFGILPVFAFANAGISLSGVSFESFIHPVPLGIIAGLFVGKQVGVFAFCALGVVLGIARLPDDLRWTHIYGTALLCGVGFTMSLFIGSLAFEGTGVNLLFDERLGIITGSLLSGIGGYLVLRMTLPEKLGSES